MQCLAKEKDQHVCCNDYTSQSFLFFSFLFFFFRVENTIQESVRVRASRSEKRRGIVV